MARGGFRANAGRRRRDGSPPAPAVQRVMPVTRTSEAELLPPDAPVSTAAMLTRPYARESVETLVSIMRHPKASFAVRRQCASDILDRAFGRPHQALIAVTTPPPPAVVFNVRVEGRA